MRDYVIFTDSACDIRPEILAQWGVEFQSLTFHFEDDVEYGNFDMDISEFYQKMRDGGIAKTSAANAHAFEKAFRDILNTGKDVLYLGFSSGLSTTCNSARMAAEDLKAEFPDRNIIVVDMLAASAGGGLLVYLTKEKKNNGASIEEAAAYAESMKLKICHWFTVDDLEYLKRGGRVSPATALVGNMLNIKPVLHVDDEGHLIKVGTARGRKKSIETMAAKYGELAERPGIDTIFISHGGCRKDAELLATMLGDRYGATVQIITDVGPVIGSHTGPGVLALFFVGKHR